MRKNKILRRGQRQTGKPQIYCNPDICPNCMYIGEGDSYCDETGCIVLADWSPTEHYMNSRCPYVKREKEGAQA